MAGFPRMEKKWQKLWQRAGVFEPNLPNPKKKFYNLMMFPYPSAEGLHVGNMYAFVGSDIYGRFKRMQGNDVFEPIGLDGFGIHSENYALKVKKHPQKQAKISEKNFYRQLEMIGNGFAWKEKLETYDPEYYKWTQWIFIQMFKHGLAYRKKQAVNWCPSCKTVLADEQVISGECERCESKVIKKELEQWFFKITNYAERLLRDLEKIDWSEKVKIAQRNWIDRSEGALIDFKILNTNYKIQVFTTRPDTLFGATDMVLSPGHFLLRNNELGIKNYGEVKKYIEKAKAEGKGKTGVELKGVKAINPANKEEIPVWVADYVFGNVGTGAIMAVPAHDERDFEFVLTVVSSETRTSPEEFIKCVIEPTSLDDLIGYIDFVSGSGNIPTLQKKEAGKYLDLLRQGKRCYPGHGNLVNSGKFDGMNSEQAKWEITKFVGGERKTQYRLRDWLISRQRYWGPPIPMIFCEKCSWQAVQEKDLPVKLPYLKDWRPKGKGVSPLATEPEFYKTKCPKCKGPARRETDVSDTFLDSSWYFFRYLDSKNKSKPFDGLRVKKWLPVDMYIGGAEHSVLHLLYVRFITKVFKEWGLIDFDEPFSKFRAHGLLIKDGAKMSKSRGNVVTPDFYIRKFGADALRMYLMFLGPFDQGGDFRDSGISGITRFLARVRNLGEKISNSYHSHEFADSHRVLHQSIKKITEDIENLRYNTAISQLMILLNKLEELPRVPRNVYETFLKLLAPFAPYISEELYQKFHKRRSFGKKNSIHLAFWPKYDARKIKEDIFQLVVQINGRVRAAIKAPVGILQDEAERLAKSNQNVTKFLDKTPKKVVFVPNKLINFVI